MKLCEPGTKFLSETVSSPLSPHIEWRLEVYPNGNSAEASDHLSVLLCYHDCNNTRVERDETGSGEEGGEKGIRANFRLYLPQRFFGTLRKPQLDTETTHLFSESKGWGWTNWCSHDKLVPMLRGDGSLLLRAEVKYVVVAGSNKRATSANRCLHNGVDEEKLMGNCREAFEKMRLSEVGADCSIVVGAGGGVGHEDIKGSFRWEGRHSKPTGPFSSPDHPRSQRCSVPAPATTRHRRGSWPSPTPPQRLWG